MFFKVRAENTAVLKPASKIRAEEAEHRKQVAAFLTQRIKTAPHTNKQQVYAKEKNQLPPSPSKPATHTHTRTSLSLYKQKAAELTPSTLHILPFIKHTKAVFAVPKYTWTVLLVKLQVNGDLFFFSTTAD